MLPGLCYAGVTAVWLLSPAALVEFDLNKLRLVRAGTPEALQRSWPEFPRR